MTYQITIEDQGESLRYREGDRSLFAGLSIRPPCTLDVWPARQWAEPEGVALTQAEFSIVTERLAEYLVARGLGPVTAVCIPPETQTEKFERLRREGFQVEMRDGKVIHARNQLETQECLRDDTPQAAPTLTPGLANPHPYPLNSQGDLE